MLINIINQEYISSSCVTKQYLDNKAKFVKGLRKMFGKDAVIVTSCPHFEFSGFITRNGKYVYFSTGDLRWKDNCLVRTAKDDKDWTGGSNNFVEYDRDFDSNFKAKVEKLLETEHRPF